MSDSLEARGPADRSRINVNEDWELKYWSKKFGVSPEQLREAVELVGVNAAEVEKHLDK